MHRQLRIEQHSPRAGVSQPSSAGARPALLDRVALQVAVSGEPGPTPFHMLSLSSHYQPILNVAQQRVEGYEGLIRGHNVAGQALPPASLFALAHDLQDGQYLDLLTRALHMRNFGGIRAAAGPQSQPLLFINVYPDSAAADLNDESLFARLLQHYRVDPSQIVMEILETGVDDEARLKDAVQLYRRLGCRVALDDFGVGFSNFDRLWRLQPDIVKIDRSVMRSAAQDANARRVLNNMVRMIHECGAAAVIEGVEERLDALIALETDADFLQGYYFARPAPQGVAADIAGVMLDTLVQELDHGAPLNRTAAAPALREYGWLVENMADAMARGTSFALACDALLNDPQAMRASLYTHNGEKLDRSLNLKEVTASEAQSWRSHSDHGWQLRRLLDATLNQPGLLRVTRPLAAHALHVDCVTLSFAFSLGDDNVVLCVDVRTEAGLSLKLA